MNTTEEEILHQIERLESQFDSYKKYSIGDISLDINIAKHGEKHQEIDNSIYIPRVGNFSATSNLNKITTKHHLYIQVVLNDKVINKYFSTFFKSALGKAILDNLTTGATIPHLNKQALQHALVAIPPLEIQNEILQTQSKLASLKSAIDTFESELSLNPNGPKEIINQLDSMLSIIGELSEIDKVLNIIRSGESKTVEFKESLSLDIKKKTKEKYIELSALKTIVALLNTEGGVLLVGVSDNGDIPGIGAEVDKFYKKSTDKFLLHVKNLIKTRIGEEFYPYIEYELIYVNQKNILIVKCKESSSPCYLDDADFYVRTNPATDKLEGPKLVKYVENHFRSKSI